MFSIWALFMVYLFAGVAIAVAARRNTKSSQPDIHESGKGFENNVVFLVIVLGWLPIALAFGVPILINADSESTPLR